MFVTLWLTVRQVRHALRRGDPETAHKLLAPFVTDGYRKAAAVLPEVSRGYRLRGEKALRNDDPEAAWKDLLAAEALNTPHPELTQFRTTLTKLGVAQCRAALLAGHPLRVIEAHARLRQRAAFHPDFAWLEDAAQEWVRAVEMADRGDFSAAAAVLDRAKGKVPPELHDGFDEYRGKLTARQEQYREATVKLHEAAADGKWADVLRFGDLVTAVAPHHRDARSLIARAWDVLPAAAQVVTRAGVPAAASASGMVELAWAGVNGHPPDDAPTVSYPHDGPPANGRLPVAKPASRRASVIDTGPPGMPKRFVLWIDGVGGYLVCLSSRVGFGQATGGAPVDVPLFADVSRMHAELSRDGEGYVLESGRDLLVNGDPTKRAPLTAGDRVTLGGTCQFVFHQPVPISPSARLELVSGHRLPLAVDGVLLMAENLILGPTGPVHVAMPDAADNVILYRSKDGLGVRFGGAFKIDNQPHQNRAPLPIPAFVTSDSFSFAVEPVGVRM
jgi:hypothetical protein